MNTQAAVAALVALSLFAGCEAKSGQSTRSSGSVALSSDDVYAYAVDTDNGVVAVVETKTSQKIAEVKVGAQPSRIVVGADDTLYVANRGSRTISVIHRGDWQEAARLEVGVEPAGLSFAQGGKLLLVVSSTSLTDPEVGTLAAFDTASLAKRWEIPVGEEPRAVGVIAGDRALVSLFKRGELVEVDLNGAKVKRSALGIRDAANLNTRGVSSSTFAPRAFNDLVVTPSGDRVFAPAVWAREDAISRPPNASGGYYGGGGPCNIGAVATAGIVTVDTGGAATPKVDDLTACSSFGVSDTVDFPTTLIGDRDFSGERAVQGPTVAAIDATGSWMYVVNRESKNVAVMPVYRRQVDGVDFSRRGTSVASLVTVGAGADGIALSNDGTKAYVYNQFDHRLDVLTAKKGVLQNTASVVVATDTLSPSLAAGRRLFYDAMDTRMSAPLTNVACSTCHLEGREDGHVWQFPDGPRQTPALAGRHLLDTAPYHWSGEFKDISAFSTHTITERMGGTGLDAADSERLDAFIDQLPVSDNPLRTGPRAEIAARGRIAFEKAGCDSCHAGALLTNNENQDVGTLVSRGANPDNGAVMTHGFNVPSLLGLGRTAPYLHDGSQTLEDRVLGANSTHGSADVLSGDEKSDLLVYLKSL